ncbi:MAG: homoserine dehydrogenase, partial [Alphaproteobacteria bacterium]
MSSFGKPLRIAIAGLGTVGAEVARILVAHRDLIAGRCGRPIHVVAVSARDRSRDRGVDLSACAWFDDAAAMASAAEADIVVELIGGADGIARELCENAIAA